MSSHDHYARSYEIRIFIGSFLAQTQVANLENGRHQVFSVVRIADQDYENAAIVSILSGP